MQLRIVAPAGTGQAGDYRRCLASHFSDGDLHPIDENLLLGRWPRICGFEVPWQGRMDRRSEAAV
jgi:hypothetical protein